MIRIIRAKGLESHECMYEHFTYSDPKERQGYIASLRQLELSTPENLFIVQAWKDEELVGFVVANNAVGEPHVWLGQAWSKPTNPHSVADAMWLRVKVWATALGKEEVRAITQRDSNVLFRRFGFEELYKVINYKLESDLLSQMVEALTAETQEV